MTKKLDSAFKFTRKSAPCPTPGCSRKGSLFKAGRNTIPVPCDSCQADADAKRQEEELAKSVRRKLEATDPGRRLRDLGFNTYPEDEEGVRVSSRAQDWMLAYLSGERRNLLMDGGVGTGKTGLAWSVVRALCERDVAARMVNFREVLAEARSAFAEHRNPDFSWRAAPVLCLDDLGAERPTDWARDELATVVERRYLAELPTIVTTNYRPSELAERLGRDELVIGQRIVSRLTQDAVRIEFDGGDRRLG